MSTGKSVPPLAELCVLRLPQVRAAVGLSETRIRELEKAGKFPKRISIGDYAVAWREIDIRQFLHSRGQQGYTKPKGATALNHAAQPRTPPQRPSKPPERRNGPEAGASQAIAEQWLRERLADGRWHRTPDVLAAAEHSRLSLQRVKRIATRLCEREGRGVASRVRLVRVEQRPEA